LVAALRAWRTGEAKRRAIAPFVVLHDRTLEAIAQFRPRSIAELDGLPGIGPAKREAYGPTILALVAATPVGDT
jgi:ATP-dependent DNA helicase RecQ